MSTWYANFASSCDECDTRIHIGDAITRGGDGGWRHVQCATPVDDDREPCPTCWLTICDCENDEAKP